MRVSYFVKAIYRKLYDLHAMTRHYVPTAIVAGHVGKNDRTVREVLVGLEQYEIVRRKGQRGGWKPTVSPADLVQAVESAKDAALETIPRRQPALPVWLDGKAVSMLDFVAYVERPRKRRQTRIVPHIGHGMKPMWAV